MPFQKKVREKKARRGIQLTGQLEVQNPVDKNSDTNKDTLICRKLSQQLSAPLVQEVVEEQGAWGRPGRRTHQSDHERKVITWRRLLQIRYHVYM